MALAAELSTLPSNSFSYNNKAVNLLSGLIHQATNSFLDDYVRDNFFTLMGIKSWNWEKDDAGNASVMAELALYPEDFAKFGTLILKKGHWNGQQLVPASWVAQIAQQSQPYEPLYGLLWWRTPAVSIGALSPARIYALRRGGLEPEFVQALQRFPGRTFDGQAAWHTALQAVLPDWETRAPNPPA